MEGQTQVDGGQHQLHDGLIRVALFDCGSQIAVVIGRNPHTAWVFRFKNPFFRWDSRKGGARS